GPRGEHQEPAGLGRNAAVVAGGGRPRGVVRQRRPPALAGRRQVQAGGGRGRGGRFPCRARPLRLLAPVTRYDQRRTRTPERRRKAPGPPLVAPQVQVSPKRAIMSSQLSDPSLSRAARGAGMDRLWQWTANRSSA